MMLRKPLVFLSALLMMTLTSSVFAQPGTNNHYLVPVVDQFDASAGIPVDIPIFLENSGNVQVTVTLDLPVNASNYFSLDSNSLVQVLDANDFNVANLRFFSPTSGTFTAILTVTDGTVTDSLLLTANVDAGPGPFVLLPPFQEIYAGIGQATQIPVSIQNLTSGGLSVQFSFMGDPEFSFSGAPAATVPGMGMETISVDFLSNVEGRFFTIMTVTDGTYTDSTLIAVVTMNRPYTWLLPFVDQVETMAGVQDMYPIMVQNNGPATVNLQATLSGSNVFTLDPSSQQLTLPSGTGTDLQVGVFSTTPGTYTALLTLTDGTTTDSLELVAIIHPGPGNIVLLPDTYDLKVDENQSAVADLMVQNLSTTTASLTVSLTGDSHFSYAGSNPISLQPNMMASLLVDFAAAPQGSYTALVTVTDGVETDSALIVANVGQGHTGGPLFTLQYDGFDNFIMFEAAINSSITKDIIISNISGMALPLELSLRSDGDFIFNGPSTMTIDSGASHTVSVTFANSANGFSEGMLLIDGGAQVEPLFLIGMEAPYTDYDGLLVMNDLDFGMVDSSSQLCLDVLLENTTQNPITINSATLSGFSSAFTISPMNNFPFTIAANSTAALSVCFMPISINQIENEVMTIAFTNPASTPNAQTATVNLTGRSTTGIRFPGDSCGIVGWYMNTISAPIDAYSDVTIELFNITSQPLTLDNAVWEQGNSLGIYSLQTPLPITIQPHNPAVPNSGKADFTVRYAPTSSSSTIGIEDVATVRLESAPTSPSTILWLTLVGMPITSAPHTSTIVLYPKNNRIPSIDMGNVKADAASLLQFKNNLQVPVTIYGFDFASDDQFEIENGSDFPKTVHPDETISLMVRSKRVPTGRTTDVLTMKSSHEHLNSRFDLISGTGVTGIGDSPAAPGAFNATISPNPSSEQVSIALNAELTTGRIQVLDMLGRVVADQHGNLQNWTWDGRINGVPAQAGTYNIRISGVTIHGQQVSLIKRAVIVR